MGQDNGRSPAATEGASFPVTPLAELTRKVIVEADGPSAAVSIID